VQQEKLFGTDGVRGIANVYPMTVEMAMFVGQAVAAVLKAHTSRQRILIGKDTRLSGYMLENALVAGICSMGGDALLVGPMPTPAVAFLTRNMRADAGIVISASHNPYEDNGIKIFGADGYKLPDYLEEELEVYVRYLRDGSLNAPRPTAGSVGRARRIDDALGRYIVALKYTFPGRLSLDGLRLAVDCAHGATYKVAPAVLSELGASLTLLGVEPNGVNINDGVGSLHPESLQRLIKEGQAAVGLAFDGDGDRLILIDEKGETVDGDHVLAICARHMQAEGILKHNTVVATVMSNLGLELCLKELGIKLLRTSVGDRNVVEAMRKHGYNLGGEQSGHLIFLDHNTTGDGLLSALQVLAVMAESGRPLYELKSILTPIPQMLKSIKVGKRVDLHQQPGLLKTFKWVEETLGGRGRMLVRYSGTEPLLRIMVESEDARITEAMINELITAAYRELGKGEQ
jgi:phosphoglucosamine mutase